MWQSDDQFKAARGATRHSWLGIRHTFGGLIKFSE
jgi:hypothetical protein